MAPSARTLLRREQRLQSKIAGPPWAYTRDAHFLGGGLSREELTVFAAGLGMCLSSAGVPLLAGGLQAPGIGGTSSCREAVPPTDAELFLAAQRAVSEASARRHDASVETAEAEHDGPTRAILGEAAPVEHEKLAEGATLAAREGETQPTDAAIAAPERAVLHSAGACLGELGQPSGAAVLAAVEREATIEQHEELQITEDTVQSEVGIQRMEGNGSVGEQELPIEERAASVDMRSGAEASSGGIDSLQRRHEILPMNASSLGVGAYEPPAKAAPSSATDPAMATVETAPATTMAAPIIRILFRALGRQPFALDVEARETVGSVKSMILRKKGIPWARQRLIFAGKELDDGCTLADYTIKNDATLLLAVRLRGCAMGLRSDAGLDATAEGPGRVPPTLCPDKARGNSLASVPDTGLERVCFQCSTCRSVSGFVWEAPCLSGPCSCCGGGGTGMYVRAGPEQPAAGHPLLPWSQAVPSPRATLREAAALAAAAAPAGAARCPGQLPLDGTTSRAWWRERAAVAARWLGDSAGPGRAPIAQVRTDGPFPEVSVKALSPGLTRWRLAARVTAMALGACDPETFELTLADDEGATVLAILGPDVVAASDHVLAQMQHALAVRGSPTGGEVQRSPDPKFQWALRLDCVDRVAIRPC